MTTDHKRIGEVSRLTGLSPDTLRWYEREGLIPPVPRTSDGRRAYDNLLIRTITLIVRLRCTGMPVADMKRFCAMLSEGAASHGRRMHLLSEHRERIEAKIAQLQEDLQAVDDKIAHYRRLIELGLDCNEHPITDSQQQRST